MYFDRFDIAEAYYVYATDWHEGQWSKEYALHSVFGRMRFRARLQLCAGTLTDNGRAILDRLVSGERKIRDRR